MRKFMVYLIKDPEYNVMRSSKRELAHKVANELEVQGRQKSEHPFKVICTLARKNQGITVNELLKILDVSRPTLYTWLNHPERLNISQIKRLARALRIPAIDLCYILC